MVTDLERCAIVALAACRFLPGSYEKRFARDVKARLVDEDFELTEKQRQFLWKMVYAYRRQIGDEALLRKAVSRRDAVSLARPKPL